MLKGITINDQTLEFKRVKKELIENKQYLIIKEHYGLIRMVIGVYIGVSFNSKDGNMRIVFNFKINSNLMQLTTDELMELVYEI